MGQLTLIMQQHNGLPSISNIYFNEIDAITELEDRIAKRMTSLSVEDAFKDGQCVNIHVDDKDLKKILKQGYLYTAFDYHPNNNGYGIPLVIKASKYGLVKEFKANHDPEATEFTIFRDSFNAAAFTLDRNNVPAGFTAFKYSGLKIS